MNGSNSPASGTRLRQLTPTDQAGLMARHGGAFPPLWKTHAAPIIVALCVYVLFTFGLWYLGFTFGMLSRGGSQLWVILGVMLPPNPGTWDRTMLYLRSMVETVGIAFLGTLLATIFAFPVGFLAAKNVVAHRIVHILSRRMLDTIRGIDTLIWALLWINVVGLGPFAGVLAIACSDFGAYGKIFSEAIEVSDIKPVEGVLASGGSKLEAVRFGMLPQVLPVITSQVLYYFESNTRSATIIGIVGAGGIGLHLSEMIRTVEWQQVSFIILLMLVTVSAIDLVSARLRQAVIGAKPI